MSRLVPPVAAAADELVITVQDSEGDRLPVGFPLPAPCLPWSPFLAAVAPDLDEGLDDEARIIALPSDYFTVPTTHLDSLAAAPRSAHTSVLRGPLPKAFPDPSGPTPDAVLLPDGAALPEPTATALRGLGVVVRLLAALSRTLAAPLVDDLCGRKPRPGPSPLPPLFETSQLEPRGVAVALDDTWTSGRTACLLQRAEALERGEADLPGVSAVEAAFVECVAGTELGGRPWHEVLLRSVRSREGPAAGDLFAALCTADFLQLPPVVLDIIAASMRVAATTASPRPEPRDLWFPERSAATAHGSRLCLPFDDVVAQSAGEAQRCRDDPGGDDDDGHGSDSDQESNADDVGSATGAAPLLLPERIRSVASPARHAFAVAAALEIQRPVVYGVVAVEPEERPADDFWAVVAALPVLARAALLRQKLCYCVLVALPSVATNVRGLTTYVQQHVHRAPCAGSWFAHAHAKGFLLSVGNLRLPTGWSSYINGEWAGSPPEHAFHTVHLTLQGSGSQLTALSEFVAHAIHVGNTGFAPQVADVGPFARCLESLEGHTVARRFTHDDLRTDTSPNPGPLRSCHLSTHRAVIERLRVPAGLTELSGLGQGAIRLLDLSHTALSELSRGCFMSAVLEDLRLPATLEVLREQCFHGATIKNQLDLRHSALTTICDAAFCMASVASLLLPRTVAAIGTEAFERFTSTAVLDLSHTQITARGFGAAAFRGADLQGGLLLPEACDGHRRGVFERMHAPSTVLDLRQWAMPTDAVAGAVLCGLLVPQHLATSAFSGLRLVAPPPEGHVGAAPPSRDLDLRHTSIRRVSSRSFADTEVGALLLPPLDRAEGVEEVLEPFAFCGTRIGELDLAPQPIEALPTGCFAQARIQTLRLPAVRSMGQRTFSKAQLTAVDLSHTSLLVLPREAFAGARVTVLRLPASLRGVGAQCFETFHSDEALDLAHTAVAIIGPAAFYSATIGVEPHVSLTEAAPAPHPGAPTLLLPATVTRCEDYCFDELATAGPFSPPAL